MIEHECGVHGGKRDREYKSDDTQDARKIRLQKADIVVVVGLKALLKQKRRCERYRTAVHDNDAPTLQHTGSGNVRPFGRAERRKRRPAVVAYAFGKIVGVEHAVDIERVQTRFQTLNQTVFTQSGDIAQAHVGIRAAADAHKPEFQPRVIHAAADERQIGHKAFGEAFSRAGKHALVFRFGGAALVEALGVDENRTCIAVSQYNGVAVEKGGKYLVHIGFHAAFVSLEHGGGEHIGGKPRLLTAQDRPHKALVDGKGIYHAVKEKQRAAQSVLTDGTPYDKRIVVPEQLLHHVDVSFQIGGKCDRFHSFTPS